ncbi:hypothetical protein JTB14_030961 [Gonioctena quinquepunctata]|nr:hypothetical protein JTB14_030961 [Gonioctena quinquepunctata]KAG5883127.1 hypothetical protein JTB14_030961 [Gonioctena quinquepunctata]
MLKLLVLVIFANSIIGCKWVCVDEKNRIMKEYIESGQFKLDYQKHEISVRQNVKKKHNNMKTTRRPKYSSDVLPEVTLRMPEIIVEPSQDICNSKEFRTSMKEMSKKVKCKPRETIVDIKYKGGKVVPEKISTKLCTGVCSGSKTCLSVERKNISLAILNVNVAAINHRLVVPPHKFSTKKFCKCKCINEEEHRLCIKKITNHYNKYVWNKNICSCDCKFEYICTTGTEWEKNQCKCVKSGQI